ncbi:MAG: hypothetical protein A2750_04375 [Candidatus Yanofskybacteria bacterium RIFCSPHIGHO2_01_FULL_45_42]|nr:MAG: hypothetical protein A2750_04375 [Candidatus Yanofskybacteria bacterium RIFCSPHIGHO2_01_FULL_45_42]
MATIPAPAAPATPAPAPTRTTPPLAPVSPTALSPVTRRSRPARTAPPPARLTYTRHATAGDSDDDRIISNSLMTFFKIIAWGGGIAILAWILFGGIQWGRATAPAGPASSSTVIERRVKRIVERSAPAQPPVSGWQSRGFPTRDDCEYHFIVVLHEAPAGRCN